MIIKQKTFKLFNDKTFRMNAIKALAVALLAGAAILTFGPTAMADSGNDALIAVLTQFMSIFKIGGTVVGAVIAMWGLFQAVMAFRREDSEGISKQIMTVVVGGAIIGVAQGGTALLNRLLDGSGISV